MKDGRINCLKCRHYFITWDSRFPKGCKFFGFKSALLPSAAVLKSDGEPCKGYSDKKSKPE